MLTLVILVVSIAAIDSLNPSTLATASFLAVGRHAVRDVALFLLGVFAVSLAGGLALALGPGQALLAVVSKPSHHTVRLAELGAGVTLIALALVLWFSRVRLWRHIAGAGRRPGRSAFILGAGIMAVELPTAVPYFGALTAVVAAHGTIGAEIALVVAYNVVFVAPLLALLLLVAASAERGARFAADARAWLDRYGPVVVPVALAVLGLALLALGLDLLRGG